MFDSKLGSSAAPAAPSVRLVDRATWVLLLLLILVTFTVSVLLLFRTATLADLSAPGLFEKSGLLVHWNQGDIVVLVRHAERCDHSTNACLSAEDGITLKGSQAAVAVGEGFKRLGLSRTDVLSSPLTRAQQTAQFMFGSAAPTQEWLFKCRKTLLQDTLAHKVPGRNLLLVTHSECINALESQLKVSGAPALDFGAALFIRVDSATGESTPLGYVEETDWKKLPGL